MLSSITFYNAPCSFEGYSALNPVLHDDVSCQWQTAAKHPGPFAFCRSLTNNMVLGLSEGFKKELTLIGVGYRASMSGAQLNLNLGFSHPIIMDIPEGLTVQVCICNRMVMQLISLLHPLTAAPCNCLERHVV